MSTTIRCIKILMIFKNNSKGINSENVFLIFLSKPQFFWMKCVEFLFQAEILHPSFPEWNIGSSHFRQENLHLSFLHEVWRNLTSLAGKSAPPIFLDDIWRISYFRQENLHPKFQAEIWRNFYISAQKALECELCITGFGLKYGKSHTSGRKFCAPSFLAEIWRNSQCTSWEKRSGESVLWVLAGESVLWVLFAISVVTLISESVLSEDFPGRSGKQPVSFRKQKTRPKLLL